MIQVMRVGFTATVLVIGMCSTGLTQSAAPVPAPAAVPAVPTPAAPAPTAAAPNPAPAVAPATTVAAASAQPAPVAIPLKGSPACFLPPLAYEKAALDKFAAAPEELLTRYPSGGFSMSQDVMRLIGSDVGLITALIELSKKANDPQASAVGAGLAQAARACVRSRPDITQIIQQAVTLLGPGAVATAFLSALGDVQTASLGGAAGGGGGGGGGAGGIGGSASGDGTSAIGGGVASSGGLNSGFSRSQLSSTATGSTTITSSSVSPVR